MSDNAPTDREKALVERIVEESKTDEKFKDEMRALAAKAKANAPSTERCPSCDGYGYEKDPENRFGVERYCKTCGGQGRIEIPQARTVCWFSAGAASAVATMLTLQDTPNAVIAYCDPGSEHPDNERFLADCERWFDRPIIRLRSEKYADTWQVWEERRFLVGTNGALCSTELKKKVRRAFQRPDDRQVFGFTAEEGHRADRFREQNIEVDLLAPLIDKGLSKADCLTLVERAGIELPAMYRLGYHNANCVGCVHGGMGYWNKIRVDFPDVFDRMALLEREIGHSLNKDSDGVPVWLDELDPDRGDYPTEIERECSLFCAGVEVEVSPRDRAIDGPKEAA